MGTLFSCPTTQTLNERSRISPIGRVPKVGLAMSRLEDMAAQSVYRGATAAMSSSLPIACSDLWHAPNRGAPNHSIDFSYVAGASSSVAMRCKANEYPCVPHPTITPAATLETCE